MEHSLMKDQSKCESQDKVSVIQLDREYLNQTYEGLPKAPGLQSFENTFDPQDFFGVQDEEYKPQERPIEGISPMLQTPSNYLQQQQQLNGNQMTIFNNSLLASDKNLNEPQLGNKQQKMLTEEEIQLFSRQYQSQVRQDPKETGNLNSEQMQQQLRQLQEYVLNNECEPKPLPNQKTSDGDTKNQSLTQETQQNSRSQLIKLMQQLIQQDNQGAYQNYLNCQCTDNYVCKAHFKKQDILEMAPYQMNLENSRRDSDFLQMQTGLGNDIQQPQSGLSKKYSNVKVEAKQQKQQNHILQQFTHEQIKIQQEVLARRTKQIRNTKTQMETPAPQQQNLKTKVVSSVAESKEPKQMEVHPHKSQKILQVQKPINIGISHNSEKQVPQFKTKTDKSDTQTPKRQSKGSVTFEKSSRIVTLNLNPSAKADNETPVAKQPILQKQTIAPLASGEQSKTTAKKHMIVIDYSDKNKKVEVHKIESVDRPTPIIQNKCSVEEHQVIGDTNNISNQADSQVSSLQNLYADDSMTFDSRRANLGAKSRKQEAVQVNQIKTHSTVNAPINQSISSRLNPFNDKFKVSIALTNNAEPLKKMDPPKISKSTKQDPAQSETATLNKNPSSKVVISFKDFKVQDPIRKMVSIPISNLQPTFQSHNSEAKKLDQNTLIINSDKMSNKDITPKQIPNQFQHQITESYNFKINPIINGAKASRPIAENKASGELFKGQRPAQEGFMKQQAPNFFVQPISSQINNLKKLQQVRSISQPDTVKDHSLSTNKNDRNTKMSFTGMPGYNPSNAPNNVPEFQMPNPQQAPRINMSSQHMPSNDQHSHQNANGAQFGSQNRHQDNRGSTANGDNNFSQYFIENNVQNQVIMQAINVMKTFRQLNNTSLQMKQYNFKKQDLILNIHMNGEGAQMPSQHKQDGQDAQMDSQQFMSDQKMQESGQISNGMDFNYLSKLYQMNGMQQKMDGNPQNMQFQNQKLMEYQMQRKQERMNFEINQPDSPHCKSENNQSTVAQKGSLLIGSPASLSALTLMSNFRNITDQKEANRKKKWNHVPVFDKADQTTQQPIPPIIQQQTGLQNPQIKQVQQFQTIKMINIQDTGLQEEKDKNSLKINADSQPPIPSKVAQTIEKEEKDMIKSKTKDQNESDSQEVQSKNESEDDSSSCDKKSIQDQFQKTWINIIQSLIQANINTLYKHSSKLQNNAPASEYNNPCASLLKTLTNQSSNINLLPFKEKPLKQVLQLADSNIQLIMQMSKEVEMNPDVLTQINKIYDISDKTKKYIEVASQSRDMKFDSKKQKIGLLDQQVTNSKKESQDKVDHFQDNEMSEEQIERHETLRNEFNLINDQIQKLQLKTNRKSKEDYINNVNDTALLQGINFDNIKKIFQVDFKKELKIDDSSKPKTISKKSRSNSKVVKDEASKEEAKLELSVKGKAQPKPDKIQIRRKTITKHGVNKNNKKEDQAKSNHQRTNHQISPKPLFQCEKVHKQTEQIKIIDNDHELAGQDLSLLCKRLKPLKQLQQQQMNEQILEPEDSCSSIMAQTDSQIFPHHEKQSSNNNKREIKQQQKKILSKSKIQLVIPLAKEEPSVLIAKSHEKKKCLLQINLQSPGDLQIANDQEKSIDESLLLVAEQQPTLIMHKAKTENLILQQTPHLGSVFKAQEQTPKDTEDHLIQAKSKTIINLSPNTNYYKKEDQTTQINEKSSDLVNVLQNSNNNESADNQSNNSNTKIDFNFLKKKKVVKQSTKIPKKQVKQPIVNTKAEAKIDGKQKKQKKIQFLDNLSEVSQSSKRIKKFESEEVKNDSSIQAPKLNLRSQTMKLNTNHQSGSSGNEMISQDLSSGQVGPYTLVNCEQYNSFDQQPYRIYFTFEVQMIMYIHSYLSKNEVIGLLGGRCYPSNIYLKGSTEPVKILIVSKIYASESNINIPSVRLKNCEISDEEQIRIQDQMEKDGVQKLAWYHSHPIFEVDPSIQDLQTHYQQQINFDRQGLPFFGVIIGPYHHKQSHSQTMFNVFHLKEEKTQNKYQRTVKMNFKDRGRQFHYKVIPSTKLRHSMYQSIKQMIKKGAQHKYDRPDLTQEWSKKQKYTYQQKFMFSLKQICENNLKEHLEFDFDIEIKSKLSSDAERVNLEKQLANNDFLRIMHSKVPSQIEENSNPMNQLKGSYQTDEARPTQIRIIETNIQKFNGEQYNEGKSEDRIDLQLERLQTQGSGKQDESQRSIIQAYQQSQVQLLPQNHIFSIGDDKKIHKYLYKIEQSLIANFGITTQCFQEGPVKQRQQPKKSKQSEDKIIPKSEDMG